MGSVASRTPQHAKYFNVAPEDTEPAPARRFCSHNAVAVGVDHHQTEIRPQEGVAAPGVGGGVPNHIRDAFLSLTNAECVRLGISFPTAVRIRPGGICKQLVWGNECTVRIAPQTLFILQPQTQSDGGSSGSGSNGNGNGNGNRSGGFASAVRSKLRRRQKLIRCLFTSHKGVVRQIPAAETVMFYSGSRPMEVTNGYDDPIWLFTTRLNLR